ncbi:hypothetical protein [Microbacterium album]|uniref:CU044_5270 family protein n=1 Tax=Microbacterium album TaxID=2053191 RepID=A0A917MJY3_9MICO|nr:hypothetical protein [Microbacterium album]GGH33748.1 hypothetical protein GCM10010921_00950 [Microbacterium album]
MDEIERRIRAARPVSGHRDLPLTDRAKRELAELMLAEPELCDDYRPVSARRSQSRSRSQRRRKRRLAGLGVAGGMATAIGIFAAAMVLAPQSVHAATPPLLAIRQDATPAEELLTRMSESRERAASAVPTEVVTIRLQAWTLHTEDDGIATSTVVAPESYELTRTAGGAYRTVVTAAQPVDRNGDPIDSDEAPEPGGVIWEENWGPGEYQFFFPDALPENAEDIREYLMAATGSTEPLSAVEAIQATNDLLFEQKLNPRQEAALLSYFAELADLHTSGSVNDRLGRDGIAFVAHDPNQPDYDSYLIVSPESGRILATEVVYHGTERTDIDSPSVVNYYAWE